MKCVLRRFVKDFSEKGNHGHGKPSVCPGPWYSPAHFLLLFLAQFQILFFIRRGASKILANVIFFMLENSCYAFMVCCGKQSSAGYGQFCIGNTLNQRSTRLDMHLVAQQQLLTGRLQAKNGRKSKHKKLNG